MSKYIYSLHNYHAIDKADVVIDGITILAGENGCGKSTLSRWLYYIVNGAIDFERFLYSEYVNSILELVKRWYWVSRDMNRNSIASQDSWRVLQAINEQLELLGKMDNFDSENVERVQVLFAQALNTFTGLLHSYFKSDEIGIRKRRIASYIGLDVDESFLNVEDAIEQFLKKFDRLIETKTKKLYESIQKRDIKDFYRIVREEYEEKDMYPSELQLKEDGVDLLEEGNLANIYNLRHAIYVDTPMAITSSSNDNIFWDELRGIMLSSERNDVSTEMKLLIKRVKHLLGGEAKLVEDEKFGIQDLRYVSEDERIDIELSKAATGVKTFAYLQRMLQNGYLNGHTLLLIDEPEAHLHPQWIVEYARLLVLINKKLGTKIMVASHNPDMVSAIRSIAEKENILGDIHFYLAEKNSKKGQYSYKDLGQNIEEIFQSFNIAIDRIKMYGVGSI